MRSCLFFFEKKNERNGSNVHEREREKQYKVHEQIVCDMSLVKSSSNWAPHELPDTHSVQASTSWTNWQMADNLGNGSCTFHWMGKHGSTTAARGFGGSARGSGWFWLCVMVMVVVGVVVVLLSWCCRGVVVVLSSCWWCCCRGGGDEGGWLCGGLGGRGGVEWGRGRGRGEPTHPPTHQLYGERRRESGCKTKRHTVQLSGQFSVPNRQKRPQDPTSAIT